VSSPLKPGARVGILGGGQLGRMLALAAARYGFKVHVFAPEADSPAFDVAAERTCAPYEDQTALSAFARSVEVATYEFENVPERTAALVGGLTRLQPGATALATLQDRFAEKSFVAGLGIRTAPFRAVGSSDELEAALATLGRPAVLKTRRFGYDGKGQALIRPGDDAGKALAAIGGVPAILEGFVPFERELSIVAVRSADGAIAAYDLCANEHRDHVLAETRVPAGVSAATEEEARTVAARIAEALGYVGVLAVELFLLVEDGAERLLVNEIAPRVHNSGHWTIEGAETSQFEQHIRAIAGWPLGSPARRGTVRMQNLLGDAVEQWPALAAEPGAHLHLYGKARTAPGRKMGHVTVVRPA
jgi:5-(carboxyamino)imidazole ribonucleotide synthase